MTDHLAAARHFVTDPRLWKTVVLCFILSCLAFAALWAGMGWGLDLLAQRVETLQVVLRWGAWIGSLIVTILLFPALFGVIGGFFYESVADAVDSRYYPHLAPADGAPLWSSIASGLKYFILLIVLNALALPVYLSLLWLAGAGAVLYVMVNGILFGRELYDAVALRRLSATDAKRWRRSHRLTLFRHGVLTALLGLVPFLNLLAPLIGIAAMTRLVNRIPGTTPPPLPS